MACIFLVLLISHTHIPILTSIIYSFQARDQLLPKFTHNTILTSVIYLCKKKKPQSFILSKRKVASKIIPPFLTFWWIFEWDQKRQTSNFTKDQFLVKFQISMKMPIVGSCQAVRYLEPLFPLDEVILHMKLVCMR